MKKIDARGLECPQPVIMTKKALEEVTEVTTVVDNEVARDNIRRFGENGGYGVTVVEGNGDIEVTLVKKEDGVASSTDEQLTVLVKTDLFGEGDPELGSLLMKNFIISLGEGKLPKTIIFMNKGVNLTTVNEGTVEVLKELENKGVTIFSCGTCLDFYELKEGLKVGEITNMYSATEELIQSDKRIII